MKDIPVSVLVTTRNEETRIGPCLEALRSFRQVIVIDSSSTDRTADIARSTGADIVAYEWSGHYPKKRQWCLENLNLAHDWIFFVDADEIVTPGLAGDIRDLFASGVPPHQGYFVTADYVIDHKILSYGLKNRKLVLFDRRHFMFPVVDDLDISGMGEMEGHYQPVPRVTSSIGVLNEPMLHYAYDSGESWESRHHRYALWEAEMNARKAWPVDPVAWRQYLKVLFRAMPFRPQIAFLHSYILKGGWLDGVAGFKLARDRYRYYRLVSAYSRKRQ